MKQETLEEAAENYVQEWEVEARYEIKQGFIEGAKWQQERSYSIDDLKEAFTMGRTNETIKDFNKQFKTK